MEEWKMDGTRMEQESRKWNKHGTSDEQLSIQWNRSGTRIHNMEQKWNKRHSFKHYCTNNLHNKIMPVVDKNGNIKKKLIRTLTFNNAWTIETPINAD